MIKPYFETKLGKLYHGDCLEIMPELEPVDLVITSPPYDDLREYKRYVFDWRATARAVKKFITDGGVCVWIVSDETKNGSESGTSFKQALWFKYIGFNIHDTMIYTKPNFSGVGALAVRYVPVFEYMFIFTNGKLRTFNPIKDRKCKTAGSKKRGSIRQKDGTMKRMSNEGRIQPEFGQRYNIWEILPQSQSGHPASFPNILAMDHIISWSNKRDLVADIMCGSGTTCVMAESLDRRWIGIEISEEYCEIAAKRFGSIDREIERVQQGKQPKQGLIY